MYQSVVILGVWFSTCVAMSPKIAILNVYLVLIARSVGLTSSGSVWISIVDWGTLWVTTIDCDLSWGLNHYINAGSMALYPPVNQHSYRKWPRGKIDWTNLKIAIFQRAILAFQRVSLKQTTSNKTAGNRHSLGQNHNFSYKISTSHPSTVPWMGFFNLSQKWTHNVIINIKFHTWDSSAISSFTYSW